MSRPVVRAQLRAELEAIGGLLPVLEANAPALNARFYEEEGLEHTYHLEENVVEVHFLNGRVGGAFRTRRPRPCSARSWR